VDKGLPVLSNISRSVFGLGLINSNMMNIIFWNVFEGYLYQNY
jgi:hypothetical protein